MLILLAPKLHTSHGHLLISVGAIGGSVPCYTLTITWAQTRETCEVWTPTSYSAVGPLLYCSRWTTYHNSHLASVSHSVLIHRSVSEWALLTMSMIRWPQTAHFSADCWKPEYYKTVSHVSSQTIDKVICTAQRQKRQTTWHTMHDWFCASHMVVFSWLNPFTAIHCKFWYDFDFAPSNVTSLFCCTLVLNRRRLKTKFETFALSTRWHEVDCEQTG